MTPLCLLDLWLEIHVWEWDLGLMWDWGNAMIEEHLEETPKMEKTWRRCQMISDIQRLVVWNMSFMTYHISGIIIPTDCHICFQRGRYTTNPYISDIDTCESHMFILPTEIPQHLVSSNYTGPTWSNSIKLIIFAVNPHRSLRISRWYKYCKSLQSQHILL